MRKAKLLLPILLLSITSIFLYAFLVEKRNNPPEPQQKAPSKPRSDVDDDSRLLLPKDNLDAKNEKEIKGSIINVTDDQGQALDHFTLIITKNARSTQGTSDTFTESKFLLPQFLKGEWCVTIYSENHVPLVTSVEWLRRAQTAKLQRSPSITGRAFFNRRKLSEGVAVLRFQGDLSKLSIRLHAAKVSNAIHYRDKAIVMETPVKDGRFDFKTLLSFGPYQVEVFSKKAKSGRKTLVLMKPGETKRVRFDLEATASLKGRFVKNGQGLGQIGVSVYDRPINEGNITRAGIIATTSTDKDGYFEIRNVPTNRLKLAFRSWEKHRTLACTHYVEVTEPVEYDLGDIEAPDIQLKGLVRDHSGKPVSGVKIWGGGSQVDFEKIPYFECWTDENGAVEITLPQWTRLEIRLDPRTLSSEYECSGDNDVLFLSGQQHSFEFKLEKAPTETHIHVPDYIPARTLYLFNEKGEYIGMGGYRPDQQAQMKIFELKKLKLGKYQVYLTSAANKTQLGDWWGMTIVVSDDGSKGPIKRELNESHSLKTREYTFDLIDGDPQYIFVSPTKAALGRNTNLMTLPVKNHQVLLKIPANFPVSLVSGAYKINKQDRYAVPAQSGFYPLNLSPNEP